MTKYKSYIVLVLVFTIIYSIFIIALSPFLVSWGDKPNVLGKIVDILMTFPINWRMLIANKSLFYVVPSGIFWGFSLAIVVYLIRKIL